MIFPQTCLLSFWLPSGLNTPCSGRAGAVEITSKLAVPISFPSQIRFRFSPGSSFLLRSVTSSPSVLQPSAPNPILVPGLTLISDDLCFSGFLFHLSALINFFLVDGTTRGGPSEIYLIFLGWSVHKASTLHRISRKL